jgi:hypothetical protein
MEDVVHQALFTHYVLDLSLFTLEVVDYVKSMG